MTKTINPIPRIKVDGIAVGETINVHADRLAAFKSQVSRERAKKVKQNHDYFKFKYAGVVNDYCSATRIS